MHPSTEDLLSVRDGEPLDAVTSNAIAEDPTLEREIERMRKVRHALSQLPELAPPDDVWERIVAAADDTHPRGTIRRLAAGAGIAAAVAALAIFLIASPGRLTGGSVHLAVPGSDGLRTSTNVEPPWTVVDLDTPFDPDRQPFDPDRQLFDVHVVPASYPALVQESARLDRVLRRLPHQRPMMSAETATTIAGLEDRIALIDEQITYSNARGVPQPQRVALWGERVDLMNALVHVRYAQAQP
jgi:hypothetical protein